MQYYDESREIRGVANDLLKSISKKAGWKLEYIYTADYDEFEAKLNNKEADVVLNIQYVMISSVTAHFCSAPHIWKQNGFW